MESWGIAGALALQGCRGTIASLRSRLFSQHQKQQENIKTHDDVVDLESGKNNVAVHAGPGHAMPPYSSNKEEMI